MELTPKYCWEHAKEQRCVGKHKNATHMMQRDQNTIGNHLTMQWIESTFRIHTFEVLMILRKEIVYLSLQFYIYHFCMYFTIYYLKDRFIGLV